MKTYRSESISGQMSTVNQNKAHTAIIDIMNEVASTLPSHEKILQLVYLGQGIYPFLIIEIDDEQFR
tara:strand:- start:399 stop:599 length:201 start_codon:yes stop_codon:yes gene_type:complete